MTHDRALDSSVIASYGYSYTPGDVLDLVASQTETGQNGAVTTTYSYDTSARLTGYTTGGSATALTLDAAGNRLTETTPSGQRVYSYNGRNQLTSVSDSVSDPTHVPHEFLCYVAQDDPLAGVKP